MHSRIAPMSSGTNDTKFERDTFFFDFCTYVFANTGTNDAEFERHAFFLLYAISNSAPTHSGTRRQTVSRNYRMHFLKHVLKYVHT